MKKTILSLLAALLSIAASATLSTNVSFEMPDENITSDSPGMVSRSRGADEPHMVVEGRTWWYGMCRDEMFAPAVIDMEFGIRIGEAVEIESTLWHKIDVVMTASNNGGTEWNYDFTSRTQAYIREDNNKVYVLHTFENTDKIDDFAQYVEADEFWRRYYYPDYCEVREKGEEVLLYVFGEQGDTYSMGSDMLSFPGTITEVGEIQSAGNTFRTYKYMFDDEDNHPSIMPFLDYIDGIGTLPLGWGNYGDFSDLFYAPGAIGVAMTGKLFAPCLRYVTDIDNNILYVGMGGMKIWDISDSVTDITVTPGEDQVKWYNLQGVEISEPDAPGVYIRSEAGTARKVVVR